MRRWILVTLVLTALAAAALICLRPWRTEKPGFPLVQKPAGDVPEASEQPKPPAEEGGTIDVTLEIRGKSREDRLDTRDDGERNPEDE